MIFCIADTFTESLSRLTGDEQKAAKTTAFDLQMNPAGTGMSFHKLDKAKDKNFWSVRVNADIRMIVHKTPDSLLLCYVNHHDKAYTWAERRKLEIHPKTGAAQLIEIRERVEEIIVPVYVSEEKTRTPKPLLFADLSDEELLSYGVPREWFSDIQAADEDSILNIADHLPAEAAEAVLELAIGGKPRTSELSMLVPNAFEHPDAQRRFRLITDSEELRRALDYPWEKWIVFLHPDQRALIEREYTGPVRISGSAGTGKTIVALHRSVHLARSNPDARILLTTFSEPLANALKTKLKRLIGNEPRLAERIEIYDLDTIAMKIYKARRGAFILADDEDIRDSIETAAHAIPENKFSLHFLIAEWKEIVDAWQLTDWEWYRDVIRLGRKTRVPEQQRRMLWSIFEKVWNELERRGLKTKASMYGELESLNLGDHNPPFDFVIVDEAQDVSVVQLQFLASLNSQRADALFFTGDLGQRIFQQPFSWKSLGIDVRGRAHTLRVNYRTSHQIRIRADRLLDPEITDIDGVQENRTDTISVFNGPVPEIRILSSEEEESMATGKWIQARISNGIPPQEIAVFIRSHNERDRAENALTAVNVPYTVLDEHVDIRSGCVSICTMHLAKGLEFRSVAVMACDDEIIPSLERIESVGDDADLQEVYDTERHLLYVACTRARDELFISSGGNPSEFIDDMCVSRL